MPRILGIDFGLRRIGIALSDPGCVIASAHSVIEYISLRRAAAEIVTLCREHEAGRIVVGNPLNMDGTPGRHTADVEAFIAELSKRINVPIEKWDERLSTRTAEQALIEGGVRRKRRKEVVDKVAASVILQHYLDAHTQDPDEA